MTVAQVYHERAVEANLFKSSMSSLSVRPSRRPLSCDRLGREGGERVQRLNGGDGAVHPLAAGAPVASINNVTKKR